MTKLYVDSLTDFTDCMFLSYHVRVSDWIHTLYLPECQGTPCSKQAWNLQFKWLQRDLKRKRDMTRTYSQMHRTYKYSKFSLIIWSVWTNGWVFVYDVSGCGFESHCSHLGFIELFISVSMEEESFSGKWLLIIWISDKTLKWGFDSG